jgi:hypothetical protein
MTTGATIQDMAARGRRARRAWWWDFVLVVLATSMVACGGSDDQQGGSGAGQSVARPGEASADQRMEEGGDRSVGPLADLLHHAPDTPGRAAVQLSDIALAGERLGIETPSLDDDPEAILAWYRSIDLGDDLPSDTQFPGRTFPLCQDQAGSLDMIVAEGLETELGFSPLQVTAVIDTGVPPHRHCAMLGDFEPETIDDVVRTEPIFSGLLSDAEVDGVGYYTWGEDGAGVASGPEVYVQTPWRRLGRGGRLYAAPDRLYWTFYDADIEAMIGAGVTRTRPSLADHRHFRELVDVLDAHHAHGAILHDEILHGPVQVCGMGCDDERLADVEDTFRFGDGIEAWGGGWGVDDEGAAFGLLVLATRDADAAETSRAALDHNLNNVPSFVTGSTFTDRYRTLDLSTEGHLVILEFAPDPTLAQEDPLNSAPGNFLLSALYRRDHPFANAF